MKSAAFIQPLDILLIGLMSWGAYKGYRRGLVVELVNSMALVGAVAGGLALLDWALALLKPYIKGYSMILPFIVFGGIFFLMSLGIRQVGYWVRRSIRYTVFGSVDDVAGAVLGMLKIMFMISTLLWVASLAGIVPPPYYTKNTFVYPIVASLGPKSIRIMTVFFPFMKQLAGSLKKILAKKGH